MEEIEDDYFQKLGLTEDESQIFNKLKECSRVLSDFDDFQKNREKHFSLWKTGGALSYELYKRLTERGIEVKFNKYCLRNRTDAIPDGPANLEFHEHIDVIHGMVSFVEFKHAHDDVGDVTIDVPFDLKVYTQRRLSSDGFQGYAPVSMKRTPTGWKCSIWEKVSDDGKDCLVFLKNLKSIEVFTPPEGLDSIFERLWEMAAEGMEPGELRRKLEEIFNWISINEQARPKWI